MLKQKFNYKMASEILTEICILDSPKLQAVQILDGSSFSLFGFQIPWTGFILLFFTFNIKL